MLSEEKLLIDEAKGFGEQIVLLKALTAVQLVPKSDGIAKLGFLAQLKPGTKVQRCGAGFNDRTTKVRALNHYYFVFLQDLESQSGRTRNY